MPRRMIDVNSIARAFEHHRSRGHIRAWRQDGTAPLSAVRFTVTLANGDTTDPLIPATAHALALGLASVEHATR